MGSYMETPLPYMETLNAHPTSVYGNIWDSLTTIISKSLHFVKWLFLISLYYVFEEEIEFKK